MEEKSWMPAFTSIRKRRVCLQGLTYRNKTYLSQIFKRPQSLTSTFSEV